MDLDRVQLWMGPNAHLVAYPMAGGQRFNVVAVSSGAWNSPGWDEAAEANDIKNQFGADLWPEAARRLIDTVESWRRWALFTVDRPAWIGDRVALLGDAAHAMLPFVAQGAAMAIEDAAVLADCLSHAAHDVSTALHNYRSARQARVARVQRTARLTGKIYHLRGPLALARDTSIRLLGSGRLLARQDWIYGWRLNQQQPR